MATIEEFYTTAQTWRNQGSYVWSGSARTGNDCSGFIIGVAAEIGAPFPYRMTAEGLRQFCTKIPKEQWQPGDLCFFRGTDPDIWNREKPGADGELASHIGIVDADWDQYMLDSHERSPTSGVEYTYLSTYWSTKLIEIRRIPQLINARDVPAPDGKEELEAWYRGYLANLLGPAGELQNAVKGIQEATTLKSAKTRAEAVADRLKVLWKEYNG